MLIYGMGAPRSPVSFVWPTNPFENRKERSEEARANFGAGGITRNEFRAEIGYEEAEDSDMEDNETDSTDGGNTDA